jgi:PiT family inorganic phosphate transporter
MFIFKRFIKNEFIYKEPIPGKKPPIWIRMLLWITCGLVSFFHGLNEGQNCVGLIMFILIAVLPCQFSLDSSVNLQGSKANVNKIELLMNKVDTTVLSKKEKTIFAEIHNDPPNALSDPNTVLNIEHLRHVLGQARDIHNFRLDLLEKYGEDNVY